MADAAEGFSAVADGLGEVLADAERGLMGGKINHDLRRRGRVTAGRKPAPTVAIIDSQRVKTVQKGAARLL